MVIKQGGPPWMLSFAYFLTFLFFFGFLTVVYLDSLPKTTSDTIMKPPMHGIYLFHDEAPNNSAQVYIGGAGKVTLDIAIGLECITVEQYDMVELICSFSEPKPISVRKK